MCLVGFEPPTCCVFRDVDALLGGFQARLLKGCCQSRHHDTTQHDYHSCRTEFYFFAGKNRILNWIVFVRETLFYYKTKFEDSEQRTSLTKRQARGKTGKTGFPTLVVMEDDRDDDVAEQVENEGLLAGRGGAR